MTISGFHLGAGAARGIVVLNHGFTGSPWDMEPVGALLEDAGYEVICRRLPGHGFPEGPENNSWQGWLGEAQGAVDEAVRLAQGRPIAVAGLSMGALLTLRLARDNAESIRAISTFAPAVEVSSFNRFGIGLLSLLTSLGLGSMELPKRGMDSQDPEVRENNPGSNPFPWSAYKSFGELRIATRAMVAEVKTPLLILHGLLDTTCPIEGSAWLEQSVGSADVSRVVLDRSGHVITRDIQLEELGAALLPFLERTLGTPA